MSNVKIERSRTEDQRRMEKHVEEIVNGATTERVTTIMEEKVPMETRKVIKETIVPVVTARKICEYQGGQVVNEAVEMVPDNSLKTVAGKPTITRDDLALSIKEAVKEAVAAAVAQLPAAPAKAEPMPFNPPAFDQPKAMAPRPVRAMYEEKYGVAEDGPKKVNYFDYVLYVVLGVIIAGIAWLTVGKMFLGN